MDASRVFEALTRSDPINLAQLPEQFGIYALWDHERRIRYIGSTPKATEGFRTRIYNKHRAGSEGRSHKFSQAYCTGRMWRYCKRLNDPAAGRAEAKLDAAAAKKLRNAFILQYCAASYVAIPSDALPAPYFDSLVAVEHEVQALAPASMRIWEGIGFQPLAEPTSLVDSLLLDHPHLAEGAERQAVLYRTLIAGKR